MYRRAVPLLVALATLVAFAGTVVAGPAAESLPIALMLRTEAGPAPVPNAAFAPGKDALAAQPFSGVLHFRPARLETTPALENAVVGGREVQRFPAITLEFLSDGGVLIPVQCGQLVCEAAGRGPASYWRVIPQYGRVWREPGDGAWNRAAFPLMLVNDTENHAHQGLASFLYRDGVISAVRLQFVQQTAPYLVKPFFVAWGSATARLTRGDTKAAAARLAAAREELAARLPAQPWTELVATAPPGTLDGFGGPVLEPFIVSSALVRGGVLYYRDGGTPYGAYPYPLEMRYGVRSVMKSVGAPLALLHLALLQGPEVLDLKIGDYVAGLDPKYRRVRFADAAGMASGYGGTGSTRTQPNDIFDGYLDANYDAWYTAPSQAEKLHELGIGLSPYPWEPGTVVRYRDQDFYLLGAALDAYLKSLRGPSADLWEMLQQEVFAPIGIHHAPAVRTREAGGRDGLVWLSAGYYPTLDDLAKIALLYQARGNWHGHQLLHPELSEALMAGRLSLRKDGAADNDTTPVERYGMGFHFTPYTGSASGRTFLLPTMSGSGENEVVLYPNGLVSLRMAKAGGLPTGEKALGDDRQATLRAVDRLEPF